MIVHNLTDVETPKLKQFGLLDCSFSIAGKTLAPGANADVPDGDHALLHLEHLCSVGAVALGDLPESYTKGKSAPKEEPKPALVYVEAAPEPLPESMLEETKVEAPSSKKKFSRE